MRRHAHAATRPAVPIVVADRGGNRSLWRWSNAWRRAGGVRRCWPVRRPVGRQGRLLVDAVPGGQRPAGIATTALSQCDLFDHRGLFPRGVQSARCHPSWCVRHWWRRPRAPRRRAPGTGLLLGGERRGASPWGALWAAGGRTRSAPASRRARANCRLRCRGGQGAGSLCPARWRSAGDASAGPGRGRLRGRSGSRGVRRVRPWRAANTAPDAGRLSRPDHPVGPTAPDSPPSVRVGGAGRPRG